MINQTNAYACTERASGSRAPASPAWTQVRCVSRTRQAWEPIPHSTVILPYVLPRRSVGTKGWLNFNRLAWYYNCAAGCCTNPLGY